jgi:aquaporin related protein
MVDFVATLGEFIGTTMFLWFAFAGTQVANIPSGDSAGNSTSGGATGFSAIVLLYIAIVFGFSLMVNVWVFFRISGGLFNPAVSRSNRNATFPSFLPHAYIRLL